MDSLGYTFFLTSSRNWELRNRSFSKNVFPVHESLKIASLIGDLEPAVFKLRNNLLTFLDIYLLQFHPGFRLEISVHLLEIWTNDSPEAPPRSRLNTLLLSLHESGVDGSFLHSRFSVITDILISPHRHNPRFTWI